MKFQNPKCTIIRDGCQQCACRQLFSSMEFIHEIGSNGFVCDHTLKRKSNYSLAQETWWHTLFAPFLTGSKEILFSPYSIGPFKINNVNYSFNLG